MTDTIERSFAQVPNACWQDYCHRPGRDGKPPGAYGIALYTVLVSLTHTGKHACTPSVEFLRQMCGLSKTAILCTLQRLQDVGLIEIVHRVDDNGASMPNAYHVRIQQEATHAGM